MLLLVVYFTISTFTLLPAIQDRSSLLLVGCGIATTAFGDDYRLSCSASMIAMEVSSASRRTNCPILIQMDGTISMASGQGNQS